MSAAIRAVGLGRVFGVGETAIHALTDAAIEVSPGELVVLRGPSGSGKTTLLNILGGLDAPTTGQIFIGDRELTTATEAELMQIRRHELGYVFQAFALMPVLSASENIELPMRILDMEVDERDARVRELLELVELSGHANQRPGELSGGQQQRVGIARALANNPRILIADEPTGQLDSMTAGSMMRLISDLVHSQSLAAIVATHDPKMAEVADRIVDIRGGRLVPPRPARHVAAS